MYLKVLDINKLDKSIVNTFFAEATSCTVLSTNGRRVITTWETILAADCIFFERVATLLRQYFTFALLLRYTESPSVSEESLPAKAALIASRRTGVIGRQRLVEDIARFAAF